MASSVKVHFKTKYVDGLEAAVQDAGGPPPPPAEPIVDSDVDSHTAGQTKPQLPDEIWFIVASYIPKSALRGLYSVNRLFFYLAMGERYGSVDFTLRTIKQLKDSPCANCVRKLHLQPGPLGRYFIPPERAKAPLKPSSKWKRRFTKLAQLMSPDADNTTNVYWEKWVQDTLSVMRSLGSVDDLDLECVGRHIVGFPVDTLEGFHEALPLVRAGWATYGANLRTMKLNIPLEAMTDALDPPSLTFPLLESLHVVLAPADTYGTPISLSQSALLTTLVSPFINRHQATLTSLTIQPGFTVPLTEFLRSIALPNVKFLSLPLHCFGVPMQDTFYRLHSILQRHIAHIHTLVLNAAYVLDLDPPTNDSGGADADATVPVQLADPATPPSSGPHSLIISTIAFYGCPIYPTMLAPAKLYNATLQSLTIEPIIDLEALLYIFPTPSFSLTCLNINLSMLDRNLFLILSKTLPNLNELFLKSPLFMHQTSGDSRTTFVPPLAEWKLRHLHVPSKTTQKILRHMMLSSDELPQPVAENVYAHGHRPDRALTEFAMLLLELYTINDEPVSAFLVDPPSLYSGRLGFS